jgi:hypothetical protein
LGGDGKVLAERGFHVDGDAGATGFLRPETVY